MVDALKEVRATDDALSSAMAKNGGNGLMLLEGCWTEGRTRKGAEGCRCSP